MTLATHPGWAMNSHKPLDSMGEVGFDRLRIGPDFQVDTTESSPYLVIDGRNIGCDTAGHVYYLWAEFIYGEPFRTRLLFRSSSDFGRTFDGDPIPLPIKVPGYALQEPIMAHDDNGHIYVAWLHIVSVPGDTQLYFTHSSDYGQTWRTRDIRIDTATTPKGIIQPRIACDKKGHVYLAWIDNREDGSHVYFNTSSDYGATWRSEDIRIDHAGTRNIAEELQLATDRQGHIYVAWLDLRLDKARLFFNVSANYGETWGSKDIRIDRNETADYYPLAGMKMTCDQSGNVYVAWGDSHGSDRPRLVMNRSYDYGVTWDEQDHSVSQERHAGVVRSMACDEQGHVYVVWHSGDSEVGAAKVFFNYSSDFGASWSTEDRRLDNSPSNLPTTFAQIVTDGTGRIYVTWMQEGRRAIYFNFSSDHGVNWLPQSIQLDSNPKRPGQGIPYLTAEPSGHAYVSWQDPYQNHYYSIVINDTK